MKKIIIPAIILLLALATMSCRSLRPSEFKVVGDGVVKKTDTIYLVNQDADQNLGNEILKCFLENGYDIKVVFSKDKIEDAEPNTKIITYTMVTAFSSFSLQMIPKYVDIFVSDVDGSPMASYSWIVRRSPANTVPKIAMEFTDYIINWEEQAIN